MVVAREGREADLVELMHFIAARMPYFMVPRCFEVPDELPKTPTPKIRSTCCAGLSETTSGTASRRVSHRPPRVVRKR